MIVGGTVVQTQPVQLHQVQNLTVQGGAAGHGVPTIVTENGPNGQTIRRIVTMQPAQVAAHTVAQVQIDHQVGFQIALKETSINCVPLHSKTLVIPCIVTLRSINKCEVEKVCHEPLNPGFHKARIIPIARLIPRARGLIVRLS